MKVIGGSEEILVGAIRPYRMEVSTNEALDMIASLHLSIVYLLRNE